MAAVVDLHGWAWFAASLVVVALLAAAVVLGAYIGKGLGAGFEHMAERDRDRR